MTPGKAKLTIRGGVQAEIQLIIQRPPYYREGEDAGPGRFVLQKMPNHRGLQSSVVSGNDVVPAPNLVYHLTLRIYFIGRAPLWSLIILCSAKLTDRVPAP